MATVDEITNLDDFQIDELTREEIFNYLQTVGVDKDSKLNTEEARKKLKKRCEALRAGQQQQQQGDDDGYSNPGGANNFSTTDQNITGPPPGDFGTLMSYVLDQQKIQMEQQQNAFAALIASLGSASLGGVGASGGGGNGGGSGRDRPTRTDTNDGGAPRSDAARVTAKPPEMIDENVTYKKWKKWTVTWDNYAKVTFGQQKSNRSSCDVFQLLYPGAHGQVNVRRKNLAKFAENVATSNRGYPCLPEGSAKHRGRSIQFAAP